MKTRKPTLDLKPLELIREDTPLEISDNVRYVNEMRWQRDSLLRVARAASAMIRHGNSPKWKEGLIPWREIAKGINPDDLVAVAEALEEVKDIL